MNDKRSTPFFGPADIAMLIACCGWAMNFVLTKTAAGDNPDQFRLFIYNLIRFPLASALLFLLAYFRGQSPRMDRRSLLSVAAISFFGNFLYQLLYMNGQNMTTSATIGLMYSFTPLSILIISIVTRIERPGLHAVGGVFIGMAGLAIIYHRDGRPGADTGALLMLAGTVCWGVYAVYSKPVVARYSPVIVTAWALLFGSFFQLPLAILELPRQSWSGIAGLHIMYVLFSAIVSQFMAYTLFSFAISRIGPVKVGIYSNMTPVLTLVLASLMRSERVETLQIAGLVIIFSGIMLSKLPERRAASNEKAAKT